ncbi:MAG: response regulator [Anaerolineae bacterium]|nr:response regulator [Anaerolineae bacterium]
MAIPTKTVLCIDDEPGMLDLTRLILKRAGFEFIGVQEGRESMDYVRQFRPDIVLLDLMLPGTNGWDIFRQIRDNHDSRETPVIIVTARHDTSDQLTAESASHVVAYLTKPFSPNELIKYIKAALCQPA